MIKEYEILVTISLIVGIIIMVYIENIIKKQNDNYLLKLAENLENDSLFIDAKNAIKNEVDKSNSILLETRINELKNQYILDSLLRSNAVTKGKVVEHLVPFVSDRFNPDEIVFLGSPIDLLSFTNIDDQYLKLTLEFIEVKSGNSSLSKRQRLIKEAIERKKLVFKTVNLN